MLLERDVGTDETEVDEEETISDELIDITANEINAINMLICIL